MGTPSLYSVEHSISGSTSALSVQKAMMYVSGSASSSTNTFQVQHSFVVTEKSNSSQANTLTKTIALTANEKSNSSQTSTLQPALKSREISYSSQVNQLIVNKGFTSTEKSNSYALSDLGIPLALNANVQSNSSQRSALRFIYGANEMRSTNNVSNSKIVPVWLTIKTSSVQYREKVFLQGNIDNQINLKGVSS